MTIKICSALAVFLLLLSGDSKLKADVFARLLGTRSSSVIEIEMSGSGTWQSSFNADRIFWAADWSGSFLNGPDLENEGANAVNAAPLVTGSLSLFTNGSEVEIEGIYLDDDGGGTDDDFALFFDTQSVVEGQAFSFGGTATFSLAELGDPDLGAQATFDDLVLGTFTSPNSSIPQAGPITLTIAQVPEPSSLPFLVLMIFAIFTRRFIGLRLSPAVFSD